MDKLFAGFDLCDPMTSVSMTVNGPAPILLAMFFNTAIRQQIEKFRSAKGASRSRRGERRDPRLHPADGARHGPGRHSQGRPGAEHLHLLHRVRAAHDGGHPAVLHRPAGAQLLLGLHQRLPHRRGRRQPDQPARLYPGQRLHLRRVLPVARHAHRRLCPQPLLLLQQRPRPRVHGHRPGGAAHLVGGAARQATAPTRAARCSSTTSRPRGAPCTHRR